MLAVRLLLARISACSFMLPCTAPDLCRYNPPQMILIRVCHLFSFFFSPITQTARLDLVDDKFSVNQLISEGAVRVGGGALCVANQSSSAYLLVFSLKFYLYKGFHNKDSV